MPAPLSSSRNSPRPQPTSSTSRRAVEERQIALQPRADLVARSAEAILEADDTCRRPAPARRRLAGCASGRRSCRRWRPPADAGLRHEPCSTSRFSISEACWTTLIAARSSLVRRRERVDPASKRCSRAAIVSAPLGELVGDAADRGVRRPAPGARRRRSRRVDVERDLLQVLKQRELELDQQRRCARAGLGILERPPGGLARRGAGCD